LTGPTVDEAAQERHEAVEIEEVGQSHGGGRGLGELKVQDSPAGSDDPGHLPDDPGDVADVPQGKPQAGRLEGAVGVRQVEGVALHEVHAVREPKSPHLEPGQVEHLGGEVQTDYAPIRPHLSSQDGGEVACAGTDVQSGVTRTESGVAPEGAVPEVDEAA
jgi:hypothetical protein